MNINNISEFNNFLLEHKFNYNIYRYFEFIQQNIDRNMCINHMYVFLNLKSNFLFYNRNKSYSYKINLSNYNLHRNKLNLWHKHYLKYKTILYNLQKNKFSVCCLL